MSTTIRSCLAIQLDFRKGTHKSIDADEIGVGFPTRGTLDLEHVPEWIVFRIVWSQVGNSYMRGRRISMDLSLTNGTNGPHPASSALTSNVNILAVCVSKQQDVPCRVPVNLLRKVGRDSILSVLHGVTQWRGTSCVYDL